jgi:hypothetical protein
MAIEIFNVEWTKLLPFDKALNQSTAHEGGVYLLFRKTGQNFKLYNIGMTKDFYKRFGTHRSNTSRLMPEADIKKRFVSFGVVTAFETSRMTHDVTTQQLHDLESFLINDKKPEGNDPSTKKGYKGQAIIVMNKGMKGLFNKTMTSCPDIVKLLKKNI